MQACTRQLQLAVILNIMMIMMSQTRVAVISHPLHALWPCLCNIRVHNIINGVNNKALRDLTDKTEPEQQHKNSATWSRNSSCLHCSSSVAAAEPENVVMSPAPHVPLSQVRLFYCRDTVQY